MGPLEWKQAEHFATAIAALARALHLMTSRGDRRSDALALLDGARREIDALICAIAQDKLAEDARRG